MDIQVFKECLWIAAVFISNYAVLSLRNDEDLEKRLPNTLNISFQGIDARKLLAELEDFVVGS